MRLLILLLLLAGCASAEDERRQAEDAERQAAYHQKCLDYGLTVGTDAYALCRQRFDETDRQERAMKRGIVLQRMLWR